MEPMKPMEPIKPMDFGPAWWPDDLGQPASSGGQGDLKYAFFPDRRRLAIQRDGMVVLYDSGEHRISGVSQEQGSGGSPKFTTQSGEVGLDDLNKAG